jgi:acetylornithine deacetylase/succinyl-diaminopimelate desuccinylase-like protein
MRSASEPDVIAAAAELVLRFRRLDAEVSERRDPLAGAESVFIGKVDGGEMYNQFPSECRLEGTRRWLPGARIEDIERGLGAATSEVAARTGVSVEVDFRPIRDAFALDLDDPLVESFQRAHEAVSGERLPTGPKPFVDDGNSFWSLARVPAITHGPLAGGQHTTDEWVSIDDLVRVARVYALTALAYSKASTRPHAGETVRR